MIDTLLIQDYANFTLWIILLCMLPVFSFARFIGRKRKQCVIFEDNVTQFIFNIKPVFLYGFADTLFILCFFFLGLIVFISVSPDIIKMRCQYESQEHYECKYIERNSLGFEKYITFSKINSAELINSRKYDNSLFNLVLNIPISKNRSWIQQKKEQIIEVFDLGFKTIFLFSYIILLVYSVAPTIKCTVNIDNNSFSIKRQRFFRITTYENEFLLDTIEGIYMATNEDEDFDTVGSRLILHLKSGDEVPVTYAYEQSDLSRLELCDRFNQFLKSKL